MLSTQGLQTPVVMGAGDVSLFGTAAVKVGDRESGRLVAILVGIGHYQVRSLPSLPGPPADCRHLSDVLTAQERQRFLFSGIDLHMYIDSEATEAAIVAALDETAHNLSPEDVILFYFSGHGSHESHTDADADPFIVMHDYVDGTSGLFAQAEVVRRIGSLPAHRSILVFDY
jgi:uncharacterized caspase-like protein